MKSGWNYSDNLYRIIVKSPCHKAAFVEKITAYKRAVPGPGIYFCTSDPVYYLDEKNSVWTCDYSDLVTAPNIIRTAGKLAKIRL